MNAQDTTARESKTVTVEVSAEAPADASTAIEAQFDIQIVSEDEEEDKKSVAGGESDESNRGAGDVRVADFFFEDSQNGRSRGDDT